MRGAILDAMIRTQIIDCQLDRALADQLNRESGRIYTEVMQCHYAVYNETGHWIGSADGEKLYDLINWETKPLLHSYSIDAAQQGFYEACKTAKALKASGDERAHYPHHPKTYRTTTWKKTGIRVDGGTLRLSLARGHAPLQVTLPAPLDGTPITQVELVYDKAARRYHWHLTTDDGQAPPAATGTSVLAGDLGEIHPCALSDGQETVIVTNRELRATKQYTNKRLAALRSKQSQYARGSRRWWTVQKRINRFLAQQARKTRDLLHKTSRELVQVELEKHARTIALGDVRDIGDGKRLGQTAQQKVSQWSHGALRTAIGYKAEACGIEVVDTVNEAFTSQTCPRCGHRHKPRGRVYRCPNCGLVAPRDGVGAVNILSRFVHGAVGKLPIPSQTKYRIPFRRVLRSHSDTGEMARNTLASSSPRELQRSTPVAQEATRL
jgi:putative transposase